MVNAAVTTAAARAAERSLALGYAAPGKRPGLQTLFALDQRLGSLGTGREPMIAQMRLTWWYEAVIRLDTQPPPAEPLLQAVAHDLLPAGITGRAVAALADGWELLIDPARDAVTLRAFGEARGATLFALAGQLLDEAAASADQRRLAVAGSGWALADYAETLAEPSERGSIAALAREYLAGARGRWVPELRPLGALVLSARADLDGVPPASPRRVARLALHRLTGR